jgi:lipoprotein signal peptidase
MTERTYRGLLWTLVLLGLVLDQSTKYLVFAWQYHEGHGGEHVVVSNCFELMAQFTGEEDTGSSFFSKLRTIGGKMLPRVNQGALFGLANNHREVANAVFAVISVLAALAIAYWSTLPTTARDRFLCAALGLILAGTIGNLYDRVVFGGVRDFIHWHYWTPTYDYDWPVFNIADCCLVVGAGLLLLQAFWGRPARAEQPVEATTAVES